MFTCQLHESWGKRDLHSLCRCAALSLAIAGIALLLSSCAQEKVIGIWNRDPGHDYRDQLSVVEKRVIVDAAAR